MVIIDSVVRQIHEHIARHAPERGGALYGPRGYPLVTHFEFDSHARTTSVSYVPSTQLIDNVQRVEREANLQFKGVIHSHPRGFARPSAGDERTVASFFRLNPHCSAMALPIVQQCAPDVADAETFLFWFRAERRDPAGRWRGDGYPAVSDVPASSLHRYAVDSDADFAFAESASQTLAGVQVIAEDFHVVPLDEHVTRIVRELAAVDIALTVQPRLNYVKLLNAELVGLVAQGPHGHEFMYFVSLDYPIVAPAVLYRQTGETQMLAVAWNGVSALDDSVGRIVQTLLGVWAGGPPKHLQGHRFSNRLKRTRRR